jgi:hypothetical protein
VYGNPLARTSRSPRRFQSWVGHADGGHQCDACGSAAERGEHIPYASVVDALSPGFTASVGAVREDDRVHAIDGGRQRIGTCQVADDHLDIGD